MIAIKQVQFRLTDVTEHINQEETCSKAPYIVFPPYRYNNVSNHKNIYNHKCSKMRKVMSFVYVLHQFPI